MRIGIITHNYPLNSQERKDAGIFVFDFAHALKERGHQVFVLSPDFEGKKQNYQKVPVTWFKWSGGYKKLGNMNLFNPINFLKIIDLVLVGRKRAIEFVKENKLDFCLGIWSFPGGLFATEAARVNKIPSGIIALGSDIFVYPKFPPIKYLIRFILRRADFRFGDSARISKSVEKLCGKKCFFIPFITSISFKKIKPAPIKKDVFNFLYVGRLEKVKGPDILVEAARILRKKESDFFINIVGPGTMKEQLKEMIKDYGLGGNVKLLGPIYDKKKLAGYYLASDSFVLPSRSDSLPFVVLEAIHAKLPTIATTVGDMPAVVKRQGIGFTRPPERPDLFARAMLRAMKEGKGFKKRRAKKLSQLADYYTVDNAVNMFLKLAKMEEG